MNVAVLGAGVSGLSCAIRLLEAGHAVVLYAERRTPDTTSDRAAAAFTPFHLDDPVALGWARASYRAFEALARTRGAECGVRLGTLRVFTHERRVGLPPWAACVEGCARLAELPRGALDGFAALVPLIDMRRYMPWLEERFQDELGGEFVHARVLELGELFDEGHELVVQAAGLGARRLANDPAVMPFRGQVVHVPNVLGLDEALCEDARGRPPTYAFGFEDRIVVGGTYEADEWIEECSERELVGAIERARELLRRVGLPRAESLGRQRLAAHAGLRPGRRLGGRDDAVRLEREELDDGRVVVHDYGHGRAGVTLSWGCAEAVRELAEGGAALEFSARSA